MTFLKVVGLAFIGVLGVIVLVIVMPLAYAVGGYFIGWVLIRVFPFAGNWVAAGITAMGIEVMKDQLPVIGAALGFVGAFFRATQTNKVEK